MSSSAATPLGLFGLLKATGAISDFVETRLATIGLSIPKLAALQRLTDAGGSMPLGQLAGRLACVKSNVTQLIDRLEADGFVLRTVDPVDKRSRLAVLTDAGRAAWEEGSRIQHAAETEAFSSLSPDDSCRLAEIIRKLAPRCHS